MTVTVIRARQNVIARVAAGVLVGVSFGAVTSVFAQSQPPTISCNSNPNIFNTGYNVANNGRLAEGSTDANWQVTDIQPSADGALGTPPTGPWQPARVGKLDGSWADSPFGTAEWISREAGTNNTTSSTGDWYYRYQFVLDPSVDPARFTLNMSFGADNSVAEAFINDVRQTATNLPQSGSLSNYGPFRGFQLAQFSNTALSNNWRTGLNTLTLRIQSSAPFEGFIGYMQPAGIACANSAPTSVPALSGWVLGLMALLLATSVAVVTRTQRARG
ncbi:MAG: hypothetical protein ACRCWJ_08290 [Casimicrobium sp.]